MHVTVSKKYSIFHVSNISWTNWTNLQNTIIFVKKLVLEFFFFFQNTHHNSKLGGIWIPEDIFVDA